MASFVLALFWVIAWGGSHNNFHLHGLWPSDSSSTCTARHIVLPSSSQFNLSLLVPLQPYMTEFWSIPNGISSGWPNSTYFWQHEWEKHGVYSGMSQFHYFQTALERYFIMNPMLNLMKAGIYPTSSRLWLRDKIYQIISRQCSCNLSLICEGDSWSEIYLYQSNQTNCPSQIRWQAELIP